MYSISTVCVVLAASASVAAAAVAPQRPEPISTEFVPVSTVPTLIRTGKPRFQWEIPSASLARGEAQGAFEVEVYSFPSLQSQNGSLVYTSSIVESSKTFLFEYPGPVETDTIYGWRVRWSAEGDKALFSGFSQLSYFVAGLARAEEWVAGWMSCPPRAAAEAPMNRLRLAAPVDLSPSAVGAASGASLLSARAYVSGSGYYTLAVNGENAMGEVRLDPAWTVYTTRSFFATYDVTTLVAGSENATQVELGLGNGWPDVQPNSYNGTADVAARPTLDRASSLGWTRAGALPKAILQVNIEYTDGTRVALVSGAGMSGASVVRQPRFTPRESGADPTSRPPPRRLPLPQWECSTSPIVNDSVYDGETYDARFEDAAPEMTAAAMASWPFAEQVVLTPSQMPPQRIVETFDPISMHKVDDSDKLVYEFNQMMAGICTIEIHGPLAAGESVAMRHAEALMHLPYGIARGQVYVGNLRSALQLDTYISKGLKAGESVTYTPTFTDHGFRFVQVEPSQALATPPTLQCHEVRSALRTTSAFSSSNDIVNGVQHAAVWSQANNMAGYPSDCPQRDERKAWTGDAFLSMESLHINFDVTPLMAMWAETIRDSQNDPATPDEMPGLGDTMPLTFGGAPADPSWSAVYPELVWQHHRFTGDARLPADHFDGVSKYIDFLANSTDSGSGAGMAGLFAHYGEWVTPCPWVEVSGQRVPRRCGGQGAKPPESLVSGASALISVQNGGRIATALGEALRVAQFAKLHASMAQGFNEAWLGATNVSNAYGTLDGLQSSQVLAIASGAAAAESGAGAQAAADVLVDDILTRHKDTIKFGISGTRHVFDVLVDTGHVELAASLLTRDSYPSFGWMVKNTQEPATTLWELWDAPIEGPGMNSRQHHMFSSVSSAIVRLVAGLSMAEGSVAWEKVQVRPVMSVVDDIGWANAHVDTPRGRAAASWLNATGQGIFVNATVPPSATGVVSFPIRSGSLDSVVILERGRVVFRDGKLVANADGITGEWPDSDESFVNFAVESGSYLFSCGPECV